jgi:hypothetical protein
MAWPGAYSCGENLTGVLEPLLDPGFFKQVHIEDGAVAWPGEIDLAPDAMYAELANQQGAVQSISPVKSVDHHEP